MDCLRALFTWLDARSHTVRRAEARATRAFAPLMAVAMGASGMACAAQRADVAAQPPADPARAESLVTLANTAMTAKRWDETATLLREAALSAPSHPSILWYLGIAELTRGDTSAAVDALGALARSGASPSAVRDTVLRPLVSRPGFDAVRRMLDANAQPVIASDTAYLIADTDLVPESIALDPVTGRLHAGSLARGAIVSVAADGAVKDFGALARRGVTQVLGMKIDSASRTLWANVKLRQPTGAAALLRIRLDDGEVLGSYEVSGPGEQTHLLNDLDFGPRGEVYVTDSEGGAVHRLEPGAAALQPLTTTPAMRLRYPNGIAVSPDGTRLFVAHVWGIAVVDLATGRQRPLAAAPDVSLCCIDGMYAIGDALLVVQPLLDVERVSLISLRGDSAVASRPLERQHPAYEFPTTGVVVGRDFLYVASSQLRRVAPDGTLRPAPVPKRSLVLRLPLPSP